MNPLQKRNNPFATPINQTNAREEEEFVEEAENIVQTQPQPVQRPQQTQRQVRKPVVETYDDVIRDKYTSTMDRTLRRSIKVLCAQRGILFASFVEDACREKLRKEGVL